MKIALADCSTVMTSDIESVGPKSSSVIVKIAKSSVRKELIEFERVI